MSQSPLEAGAEKPVDAEVVDKETADKALATVPAPDVPQGRADLMGLSRKERHEACELFYEDYQDYRTWLFSKMIRGIHYGNPPGCDPKKDVPPEQWTARGMFYKAGAQFVASLHAWVPTFEADMKAWEQGGKVNGAHYRICRLHQKTIDGPIIAMGNGMAQVGQKNRDGNAAIKCGNKCALSDAVLNRTGLADLFTQDGPPGTEEGASAKSAAASRTGKKPPSTETANAVKAINALYGAWCMAANLDTKDKEAKEGFGAWAESILQRSVPPATEITVKETGVLAAWFKANGVAKKVNA